MTTAGAVFWPTPYYRCSSRFNCSAVEINLRDVETDAGKQRKELCPDLPSHHRNPEHRLSPVTSHLGGEYKVLVPEGLELLPPFLSPEKLLLEEEEEVIEEHPEHHGCLYRIETLHREATEGKVLFQFFYRVLIVRPGLAPRPDLIRWFW